MVSHIHYSCNRYRPTILLLRHFDVFRTSAHESSPNDQVGIASEVASVIREFTEPVTEDEEFYSKEETNGDYVRYFSSTHLFNLTKKVYYGETCKACELRLSTYICAVAAC